LKQGTLRDQLIYPHTIIGGVWQFLPDEDKEIIPFQIFKETNGLL